MINQNEPIWNESYLNSLRGKIFKIIPLVQQKNENVYSYVNAVTFQVSGLKHVVEDLENNHLYIDMWAVLEETLTELLAPDPDVQLIRSELLRIVNSIDKMQKRSE